MIEPFCPLHSLHSRPVEVPGLRCDCAAGVAVYPPDPVYPPASVYPPDPELTALRASHQRLCDEYQALVADVIAMLGCIGWPRDAAARVAIEGVRARIGLGAIPEPDGWRAPSPEVP